MTIQFNQAVPNVGGVNYAANQTVTLNAQTEYRLVGLNLAAWVGSPPFIQEPGIGGGDVSVVTDPITGIAILTAGGSASFNDAGLHGASTSATAAVNTAAIQAALNAGGLVTLNTPGIYLVNAPALVGSHTKLVLGAGVTLRAGGTHQGVMVRTGNAEFVHGVVENGVTILGADTQAAGTGQLKYDFPSTSFSWKAPGDTAFGTPVNVGTTLGKYKVPSTTSGKAIYIAFSVAMSATATYNVAIAAHNGAASVALSCTSNVVTATEVNHGRKSGDMIQIYGEAAFNGSFLIEKLSADTYSYAHTRANGTSSTASAYGMSNIELDFTGATIDGQNGTLTQPGAGCLKHNIVLRNVNDLSVYGGHSVGSNKYAVVISACARWKVRDWTADTSSDTIHPLSPLIDGLVENITAKGGDNVIGLGNSEYAGQGYDLPTEAGYQDCKNLKLLNIRGVNTTFDIVRLYGSDTGYFRDVVIDGVHGTFSSTSDGAVAVYSDGAAGILLTTTAQNNITNLKIKNITAQCVDTTAEKRQVYISGVGTKDKIEIDGVLMCQNGKSGGLKGSIYINATIGTVIVKNLQTLVTPYCGFGVYLGAAANIGKLRVSDVTGTWNNTAYATSGSSAIIISDQSATVVTEVEFTDFNITDTSASGAAVNGLFFTSPVVSVSIRHGYTAGMKNLCELYWTAVVNPRVNITDITGAISGSRNTWPLKISSNGGYVNISNLIGNFAYIVEAFGTGALKIRTSNTQNVILSGSQGLYVSGGSATYDVSGDILCTMSQIGRVAGNMVKTYAIAGTIPAGVMAVCSDSGTTNSWKAVHDTTLVY